MSARATSIYTSTTGIFSRTLYAWNPASLRNFPFLPGSRQRCLIPMQIQCSYEHTFLQHSSRLYAQETLVSKLFKTNGNAQQNPLCAASCFTKDIPISPQFSPNFFYRQANPTPYSVCVCVFFPFILDIKFVGRTSRGHTGGRSHGVSHPPSFCGACLNFFREKDSAIPFPRRP